MAKVDFTQILTDLYGAPITGADGNVLRQAVAQFCEMVELKAMSAEDALKQMKRLLGEELTLGHACVNIVQAALEDTRNEDGRKIFERFEVARKIVEAEASKLPVELDAATVTLIKTRLPKVYQHAAVLGRVWELIEPPVRDEEPA